MDLLTPNPTATYPDLAGKVAVVTGGSRGIGARTGRELARQGASVILVGRDAAALDAVVAQINAEVAASGSGTRPASGEHRGHALGAVADVTDAAALDQVRDLAESAFGPVGVLAAFAGGLGMPTPSVQLTEQRFREVLDSELTSAFLTVRTFLPGMVERGAGSILLMSSSAGRQPSQANLAYGVANAGVVMLARHLAAEVGPAGVRVNCLAPTSIRTEKVAANMPAAIQEQVANSHPLRRLGTPEDVAAVALFLASDAAAYLTGLTVDVAGGRVTN